MSEMDKSAARYLLPVAVGALTGLRTATPVAAISLLAGGQQKRPVWMKKPEVAGLLAAMAVGEWVVDKLPGTPSRLEPLGLIARVAMGAVCGAAIADAIGKEKGPAAIAGGVGAMVGAVVGYKLRMAAAERSSWLKVPSALVEDAVAVAGATLVASAVSRLEKKSA